MDELFFSIDIETDGQAPGLSSMLSIGAVAFLPDSGEELGEFSANLAELPDAWPDAETMKWWAGHGEAWKDARQNLEPPETVMRRFEQWVKQLCGEKYKPVAACMPTWDFHFIHYYLIRYLGRSIFGHRAYCIKTAASHALGLPFRKTSKAKIPKDWFGGREHTHRAIEDAREQAHICVCVRRALRDDAKSAI